MRTLFLLLVLFFQISCSDNFEEKKYYSEWVETTTLEPNEKTTAEAFQNETIPLKKEVPIPKYPGAKLLVVNEKSNGLQGLILVSKATSEDIIKWYKTKLSNYSSFETELGYLYIEGNVEEFNYNSDSLLLLEKQHLIITNNNKPRLRSMTPEYNSMIEISYNKK